MNDFQPFPIYDLKYGKVTAKKPWLLPQDAFKELLNAYVERGVLKKRKGYTEWGRMVHLVEDESVGTGDKSEVTFSGTLANVPIRDLEITDGVEKFTDNGDGTLTGDAGGVGTIVYETGAFSVTFNAAPEIDADITADYNFYPGLPVMGIWEHYTATGRYLLAFDTKRMCKYNSTTSLLNDMAEEDTWTGLDYNFFHCCSATDDKIYITNGVDQIRTWDGTTLAALTVDYTGGSTNKVNTCKFIFEYHGHIVLLAPTEETVFRPRRCRSSTAGTYTTWPSYGWVDCPTPDEIMGAQMIGNVLYVWFKESLWKLNYTGIYTSPFEWERVSPEEGLYAPFSTITIGGKSYGIGKSAIIATDGVNLAPVDSAIPDGIISDYDVGQVKYGYAGRIRDLRQIWWTACAVGSTEPDRVLAFNYEDGNFFPYDLAFMCFGSYTAGSTLTMDDIEDAWDDIEYTWDTGSAVAGYPLKLAGDHDGYIFLTNDGYNDNGEDIEFLAETGEWNPYIQNGLEANLGWVDFFLTTNDETELTIDFYVDQDPTAYLTKTLTFEDESGRDKVTVWKRVYVGAVGSHHRMRIYHTASEQPVEIHAIVPYFKQEGAIHGY